MIPALGVEEKSAYGQAAAPVSDLGCGFGGGGSLHHSGEVGRLSPRGVVQLASDGLAQGAAQGLAAGVGREEANAKPAERNPLDAKVRALEAQVARLEHELRTRSWTCREKLPGCWIEPRTRNALLMAVQPLAAQVGVAPACQALGVSRATFSRAPADPSASMIQRGLLERPCVRSRRRSHAESRKRDGPNQTSNGPTKWTYFYLYVVLDISAATRSAGWSASTGLGAAPALRAVDSKTLTLGSDRRRDDENAATATSIAFGPNAGRTTTLAV